jgi:preprotein translocase subunit SecG
MPLGYLSQYIFGPILFLLSFFIIAIILLQRGRGGGLTGALGGMGGQSAFGVKAGDIFTRVTAIAVLIWIFTCALAARWYKPEELDIDADVSSSTPTNTIGAGDVGLGSGGAGLGSGGAMNGGLPSGAGAVPGLGSGEATPPNVPAGTEPSSATPLPESAQPAATGTAPVTNLPEGLKPSEPAVPAGDGASPAPPDKP